MYFEENSKFQFFIIKDDEKSNTKKVASTKYYDVIGVSTDSAPDVIKKAYKKLLIKHHPDKGGSAEKFREIQEAYEILSDPEQRDIYDKYGEDGLKKGFYGNEENVVKKRKTPSLLYTIRVTLEDIYLGTTKSVEINREVLCKKCKGTGSKNCVDTNCNNCRGIGYKIGIVNSSFGLMQQKILCPGCNGKGNTLQEEDKCLECKGSKIIKEIKIISVDIDKGAPDGCRYNFTGEGNQNPGMEVGDLHVELFLEDKSIYERKGADLATTVDIDVVQSLGGFEIELKHLDGRSFYISNKPGEVTQPGTIKTIKDLGLPFYGSPLSYGNLYVSFNVVMPKVSKEISEKLLEVSLKILL